MMKAYKFRVYPTRKQENMLLEMLECARFVYNRQLELKIQTYRVAGKSISQFELNNSLIGLKEENPMLRNVHSQVLQNINKRISLAFQNFYSRVKKGQKPGFPRFKGKNRYSSITYSQSGFSLGKKLRISKIGEVSIVKHRNIEGKIKTMTLKRANTGKWFVIFSVEQAKTNMAKKDLKVVGVDMGLCHFYADSEGHMVDNPRYLRKSEQKLAQLQKGHSRKKKGSNNRQKSRLKVAKIHERIANQRHDFLHKESRKLANSYSHIAVEKLHITSMTRNRYLAKSIADASWHKFIQMLAYKVEETGGKLLKVNAQGTSQRCICGNKVEKTLATRIHKCNRCGIRTDRDIMSAMIIKQLALEGGTTAGSAESNAWGDERMLLSVNQESKHQKPHNC